MCGVFADAQRDEVRMALAHVFEHAPAEDGEISYSDFAADAIAAGRTRETRHVSFKTLTPPSRRGWDARRKTNKRKEEPDDRATSYHTRTRESLLSMIIHKGTQPREGSGTINPCLSVAISYGANAPAATPRAAARRLS